MLGQDERCTSIVFMISFSLTQWAKYVYDRVFYIKRGLGFVGYGNFVCVFRTPVGSRNIMPFVLRVLLACRALSLGLYLFGRSLHTLYFLLRGQAFFGALLQTLSPSPPAAPCSGLSVVVILREKIWWWVGNNKMILMV